MSSPVKMTKHNTDEKFIMNEFQKAKKAQY